MRTFEHRLAAVGKQQEDEDGLTRAIRTRVGFRTGTVDAQGVRSGVTGGRPCSRRGNHVCACGSTVKWSHVYRPILWRYQEQTSTWLPVGRALQAVKLLRGSEIATSTIFSLFPNPVHLLVHVLLPCSESFREIWHPSWYQTSLHNICTPSLSPRENHRPRCNHRSRRRQQRSIVGSICLLYTSPSPRDQRGSRMPSSA